MPFLTPSSVALITAGSAGLGAAIARAFAAAGARVVVNYAGNKERADALVEELAGLRPASTTASSTASASPEKLFTAIRADVTSRTEINRLVDETLEQMGRLDVVISNQGWTRFRDFMDLDDNVDESDWDGCFNVNVKSHLWLMHASKKALEEGEGGAFVTTASLAGVVPSGSSLVGFFFLVSFFPPFFPSFLLACESFPSFSREAGENQIWEE